MPVVYDDQAYPIKEILLQNTTLFDRAISVCDELAEIRKNIPIQESGKDCQNFSEAFLKNVGPTSTESTFFKNDILLDFYHIFCAFRKAKENKRDSIWRFILQNSYKPRFKKKSEDFVIGNPPWLTYKDVTNPCYQNVLKKLAERYNVIPNVAGMPHLELAALFLAHATSYCLRPNAQAAFVLPRSILNADHHQSIRTGNAKGFNIIEIWNLKDVSPLFNVPACVLFVQNNSQIK